LIFLGKLQILRSALTAPSALSAPSCTLVVPDFGPTWSGNSDVNRLNSIGQGDVIPSLAERMSMSATLSVARANAQPYR